jgi:hypothetical protein
VEREKAWDIEATRKLIDLNLLGPMICSREAVKRMAARSPKDRQRPHSRTPRIGEPPFGPTEVQVMSRATAPADARE